MGRLSDDDRAGLATTCVDAGRDWFWTTTSSYVGSVGSVVDVAVVVVVDVVPTTMVLLLSPWSTDTTTTGRILRDRCRRLPWPVELWRLFVVRGVIM